MRPHAPHCLRSDRSEQSLGPALRGWCGGELHETKKVRGAAPVLETVGNRDDTGVSRTLYCPLTAGSERTNTPMTTSPHREREVNDERPNDAARRAT